jgi:precorrin-2 dehydrogenase / sirohydrochlorin ferrochelatase
VRRLDAALCLLVRAPPGLSSPLRLAYFGAMHAKAGNARTRPRARKILPVDLLIEGRPCLVAGAGKVAARKIGHLLAAGARVRVVAPAACATVARWAAAGRVAYAARGFRAGDAAGQCLVFAATDDPAVNRRVLACCRRRRILCNAADSNWPEGDFVTPAVCRAAGLTVTVSTGGRSCRTARAVKERIAKVLAELARARD